MTFASQLALIAIAIAAASTNALTFDVNQPFVEGPGPEIFPTPTPTPDTSMSATGSLGPVGSSSSSGFSSTCAMDCPSDYIPVCGSDGVTYGNTCKLVLASCQSANKDISKKSDGPCP